VHIDVREEGLADAAEHLGVERQHLLLHPRGALRMRRRRMMLMIQNSTLGV